MARYLSEEWFALVSSAPLSEPAIIVLEQLVRDTPSGDVVYRVEVSPSRTRVVWPVPADAAPADLRISTDWETAVSVARGDLSTQRALMQGRFRVGGRPDQLAGAASTLAGFDPVPSDVRANTTFGE